MSNDYTITAKMYDPLLYFALRNIRSDIVQLIPNHDARILDMCCGTGDQLKKLSNAGFSHLTGVDLSPAMLNVAKKKGKVITLLNQDVQHTDLPDASFDVIIISFAVHEKTDKEQNNMLAEAGRLLIPDGHLILADFSLDDQANVISKIGVTFIEGLAGGEHYRNFKAYVNKGGMESIIQDRFHIHQQIRHALGAVSIWVLTKRSKNKHKTCQPQIN